MTAVTDLMGQGIGKLVGVIQPSGVTSSVAAYEEADSRPVRQSILQVTDRVFGMLEAVIYDAVDASTLDVVKEAVRCLKSVGACLFGDDRPAGSCARLIVGELRRAGECVRATEKNLPAVISATDLELLTSTTESFLRKTYDIR
ncbi:MAG: hypothetical protein LBO73_04280 [Holosporaceae bacterium]|jgi:hypothetical protein|nr:hypothetical protein [Holosporaceae bacterium]